MTKEKLRCIIKELLKEELQTYLKESTNIVDKESLYRAVENTVNTCLQQLKLNRLCIDSYDNSYDTGKFLNYELQWNFINVPNISQAQTALSAALTKLSNTYGITFDVTFDDEALADEGFINLTVAYELPY